MALSQVQCLDDNHVNVRTHESKAEFLYCEDQRLALEAFLRDGRDALAEFLCAQGLRGFLSDPELESLAEAAEPYDPGSELFSPQDAGEGGRPLSLQYWPELSDTSIPQMDLSWPDNVSYRGVTRTTVYAQPPLEGQVHIKEVVRKMIAQAQKMIAVVMDVFTDVDIFRDLLDAGFRRRVSVYILLERKTLPHFQSMCQRANMHAGHLKNLRVRCTDGAEFHSRSCIKVRGRMGHRFMFIDGDKAVSGSYSFTWMSSRLDKNLITVVTGQAVEAFDKLFRVLYATSTSVDLRQVATGPQPEPEPLPQPVAPATTSAAMAKKLYSPKYAALGNPAPTPAPKETDNQETKMGGRKRASKEAIEPPIHPGLTNLEKACMMSYLPTWPEPDPPSDVIGFINIRDPSKPNQGHLQRSEMSGTKAIRFSSPFSMPEETLPQVATPRPAAVRHQQSGEREEANARELGAGAAPPTPPKKVPEAAGPKSESDTAEALRPENKRRSNTLDDGDTPIAPLPSTGGPQSGPQLLAGSRSIAKAGSNANGQRDVSQEAHTRPPGDSDGQTETTTSDEQPLVSCEPTPNVHTTPPSTSVSAASLSQNSQASGETVASSSSIPARLPTPSSPSLASTPPVPKPRTVKLVFEGRKLPELRSAELHSVRPSPEELRGDRGDEGPAAAAAEEEADAAPNVGEAPRPAQCATSRGTEGEGRRKKAAERPAAGNEAEPCVVVTEAQSVNNNGSITTAVVPRTVADSQFTPQMECVAPVRTDTKARQSSEVRKMYLARSQAPQRISYSDLTPMDVDVLRIVEEQDLKAKASTHPPERPRLLRLSGPGLDGETRPPSTRHRATTPDRFSPRTANADSPDFQTPTSEGYTSEEYYECDASISDSEGSSGPDSVSSLSSLKDKMWAEKVTNGRGEDESDERTREGYQGPERRGNDDPKITLDHIKQDKNPTRAEEENQEARAMKTKRGLNQSAVENLVVGRGTWGEITNERRSIGDLHQEKPSERKRTDWEVLGPSGAERRDRPPDVQKRGGGAPSSPGPPAALWSDQASGLRPWGSWDSTSRRQTQGRPEAVAPQEAENTPFSRTFRMLKDKMSRLQGPSDDRPPGP